MEQQSVLTQLPHFNEVGTGNTQPIGRQNGGHNGLRTLPECLTFPLSTKRAQDTGMCQEEQVNLAGRFRLGEGRYCRTPSDASVACLIRPLHCRSKIPLLGRDCAPNGQALRASARAREKLLGAVRTYTREALDGF